MRRRLAGWFLIIHAFAHSFAGMSGWYVGRRWAAVVFAIATVAYLVAGLGLLRVPVLRLWWKASLAIATVASLHLLVWYQPPWAIAGMCLDVALFVLVLGAWQRAIRCGDRSGRVHRRRRLAASEVGCRRVGARRVRTGIHGGRARGAACRACNGERRPRSEPRLSPATKSIRWMRRTRSITRLRSTPPRRRCGRGSCSSDRTEAASIATRGSSARSAIRYGTRVAFTRSGSTDRLATRCSRRRRRISAGGSARSGGGSTCSSPGASLDSRTGGRSCCGRVDSSTTRLIVRTRGVPRPGALSFLTAPITVFVFEPAHFIMERGMLRGIRDRAEGSGS